MGIGGFTPFGRSGFNRARHARLAWRGAVQTEPRHPVEAVAVANLPGAYGVPSTMLTFTLDVIIRASAYIATSRPRAGHRHSGCLCPTSTPLSTPAHLAG